MSAIALASTVNRAGQDTVVDSLLFAWANESAAATFLTARRGLQSGMSLLQAEVERRGTRIFDLVDRHPESIFSKAGFYQRMMEFSMRDEHFQVQMFRFVDVLASLRRGSDIVQHLDEYFADMRNGYAPLIRTGVSLARIVPIISGKLLRWNV